MPGVELHFHGNTVMPEEVYRAVLSLPLDAAADRITAASVREQLEAFLHRSGYDLARVEAHVRTARDLEVDIDEGQLEKVVFRGRLTLATAPGTVAGRPLRWGPPAPSFGTAVAGWPA